MNSLVEKTKKFLKDIVEHPENYRYLLGVSGGPDSMAMGKIFQELGFNLGIAHCNLMTCTTPSTARSTGATPPASLPPSRRDWSFCLRSIGSWS